LLYLIGSIVLSSYLTLSFKVLQRVGIPAFQAIVFNYITCVITGSIVNGSFPISAASTSEPWFKWALIMGSLFILLFNLIAFTTQNIGVAVASVANKLSLVIPFVFSLYLYNESSTWVKIAGIIIALAAVFLTCLPPKQNQASTQRKLPLVLLVSLPAILFLGSGLLDSLIKYVEQTFLNEEISNAYLITSFATAATFGILILIALIISGKQKFDWRSIVAGIIIGVPNYFSIWCLVYVLKDYQGRSSAIIPINNMGIVLLSSVVAWLLFKERLSAINWVGIILSLIAIALIAFG
jgi:drug/metabolite transporter (DMT)-like permease